MKMLTKFSLLIILILYLLLIGNTGSVGVKSKHRSRSKGDEDDLYGEDLDSVVEAFNKSEKLYKTKQTNYFSDYFTKVDLKEVPQHAGNLMNADQKSVKSFRRLNAIANNVVDGDKKLKSNGTLKSTLKAMLKDNQMKPRFRVDAAKLASRLNDMPVTIQMTSKDVNKKPKNFDTYIVVPRLKRLYRPDYYIENYKAGNWDA